MNRKAKLSFFKIIIAISVVILISQIFFTDKNKIQVEAKAPYPQSTVIKSVTWDFTSQTRLAPGSDLWPVTWGPDNKLYVSWGDGGGFGGNNKDGRVSMGIASIDGPPTSFIAKNINGGVRSNKAATWDCSHCGKTNSLLSVNGILFSWINMQNASPPDSRLAWSEDLGVSWEFVDWIFPGDGKFVPGSFANYGQDYKGAKDNYIYIYGNDRSDWRNLYLARVDNKKIKERAAYEFLSGMDDSGNPIWNDDVRERQEVAYDPDGIGATAVVYNSAISRYLLTTHHGSFVGRFGFFDSENPWGPWTTVGYYNNWGDYGSVISGMPHSFPAKWISTDGKEMYMTFSGTGDLDSFNLMKVSLTINRSPVTE